METVEQPNLPEISETGLLEPSTAGSTLELLRSLPLRLDDRQLAQVKAIAKADLPLLPSIDEKSFTECMRALTILPRRADDDVTGEIRVRIYGKSLGHMPKVQFWWIVEEAVKRCKWFPSIKELLDIGGEWRRRDDATEARYEARKRLAAELSAREMDYRRKPAPTITQDAVDSMMPELVRMGLKCGALIEIDGKVVPAPEETGAQP